jgi:hypothetical protein
MITTAAITITGIAAMMTRHSRRELVSNQTFAALLIVLAIAALCVPVGSADSKDLDTFAQCLAEKKVTMYGSFLCPHCDDQKKLFGSSFRYVPYVECSIPGSRQMTFACMGAQIHFTPTWTFANGDRLTGVQPLKTLGEKAGCRIP